LFWPVTPPIPKKKKNVEVEMAIRKWLRMQERDFFHAGVSKFVPTWGKCIFCYEVTMTNIDTAMK
jgi:hypothetical protein